MIKFEMIGKLSANKDSDKFKSYEEKELGSKGWIQRTYKFGVTSGNNHFFLQSQGGKFKDESNKIYVFGKGTVDEDGNRKKGEMFTIDFKNRLTDKRLNEVADFRKFVFDTEKPGRRWRLKQALEKFEEGTKLDKEELDDLGVKSMDDLKSELALSEKRRKEFISAWDYAEYIKKVIDSEKYKDSKFHIYGEYEFQYSEAKGTFYKNYVPQKIYLADQSEEDRATATVDFYYNEASLDTTSLVDTNKYYVNGYIRVYDNSRKSDIPAPYTIVIPAARNESDLEKKREKTQVSRFEVTDGMVKIPESCLDKNCEISVRFEYGNEDYQYNRTVKIEQRAQVITSFAEAVAYLKTYLQEHDCYIPQCITADYEGNESYQEKGYLIHGYDDMGTHVATSFWYYVASDGKIYDMISQEYIN